MANKFKLTTMFGSIVAVALLITLLGKLFSFGWIGLAFWNIVLLFAGIYLFSESLVLFGKTKKSWKQYLHIFSFGLALVLIYMTLVNLFSGGIESPAGRGVSMFFLTLTLIDVIAERFVD